MKTIVFIILFFAANAHGQGISNDTTPVWVVYLDSARVFAAYPGVDMRLDVAAGWKISSKKVERYLDIEGVEFSPEMVLFSKPRKIIPNAFRQ